MFTSMKTWSRQTILTSLLLALMAMMSAQAHAQNIQTSGNFDAASMTYQDGILTVSTGKITRQWRLTGQGLLTTSLTMNGVEYIDSKPNTTACAWKLGNLSNAKLVSLTAAEDDDEKFTSKHLNVTAVFDYPAEKIRLQYEIWAYPNANGIRTQIKLRGFNGYTAKKQAFSPQIVESLNTTGNWQNKQAFGYIQGIKTNMDVTILKEQTFNNPQGDIFWPNGLVLSQNNRGLILLKESNKHFGCRKKDDLQTGGYKYENGRFTNYGAGLLQNDVRSEKLTDCWASWVVAFEGNQTDATLALKQFDRKRFPIDPKRDIYILANTWGTEDKRPPCLHAAREENVLREINSAADLGIDVLQIDDGWQTPKWVPANRSANVQQRGKEIIKNFGDYPVYPQGWTNVVKRAQRQGVKLGLWAAWRAPENALTLNYDKGNFKYYKLDFAHLNTRDKYDYLANKARNLIKHTDYTARVNWDVTELAPRMGYFTGREYGNVYLANRKMRTIRHNVLYVPHKILNDAWNLSKYININKFQVTVQNIDHTLEGAPTDANEYTHDYAVGISLMSSPIFFQETRYYEGAARNRVRFLLSVYKKYRNEMFQGYVFPIGDEPDNKSWAGFQNHNQDTGVGFLTIFRELHNTESTHTFNLNFLAGSKIKLTNLLTDEASEVTVGPNGEIDFTLPEAPGFMFLRYESK